MRTYLPTSANGSPPVLRVREHDAPGVADDSSRLLSQGPSWDEPREGANRESGLRLDEARLPREGGLSEGVAPARDDRRRDNPPTQPGRLLQPSSVHLPL